MNVKIFYGGSSGFRKILPSSTNYMPIVDLAILDDSRNRKVKVDVQGNRVEEEEEYYTLTMLLLFLMIIHH